MTLKALIWKDFKEWCNIMDQHNYSISTLITWYNHNKEKYPIDCSKDDLMDIWSNQHSF